MTTKVNIFKDDMGDWQVRCWVHDERIFCPDWEMAYELAMGHLCMHHTEPTA